MTRHVRLRELLVGIEGLALIRHLYECSDEDAERRLAEVRRLLDDDQFATGSPISEADPRAGYRSWADNYDEPGNMLIPMEQPVVWSLLESSPPGRALDAACGTGRHTGRLVELGHDVVGVDLSAEMLRRAAAQVPKATFAEADLRGIPASSQSFDLVVCALALAHLAELDGATRELARVLKVGGRAVISVFHPFQAFLGGHAPFEDSNGERGFVREHAHGHADYLAAFRSAGLLVQDCLEPQLTTDDMRAKRRAMSHIPEATVAAWVGLPGALIFDLVKD